MHPPPKRKAFSPVTAQEYKKSKAWGMALSLDIQDCDKGVIQDAGAIRTFVHELCERIKMKRFGETVVVDFGDDPKVSGYSMTQLIETSLISGHFVDKTGATHLDIFSCKWYDSQKVIDFALEFFGGGSYYAHCALRGCPKLSEKYVKEFSSRNISVVEK